MDGWEGDGVREKKGNGKEAREEWREKVSDKDRYGEQGKGGNESKNRQKKEKGVKKKEK